MTPALTLRALRAANLDRLPQFRNGQGQPAHDRPDGSDWSLNDWFTAVTGEVGELGNLLKKVRRGDFTIEEARTKIAGEIADVLIYLDILAFHCGVALDDAAVATFNAKSEQVSATTRLRPDPTDTLDLRARYDVQTKELQRVRDAHAADRVETRSLRAALGLAHDAPPAPARNFGGG